MSVRGAAGRTGSVLGSLLVYAAKGAAIAGGAIVVTRIMGPTSARDLGDHAVHGALDAAIPATRELAHDAGARAGEGFAEGMAGFRQVTSLVSGDASPPRGHYR